MDVSVIVVAWNVRELLDDCLASVFDKTRDVDFEVIYVDNGSVDGSVALVKEKYPRVKIIENDENKGFIIANNQGIEIANGRYVLLLNSDTILLNDAISKAVRFADERPEAAVVGCKTFNRDGSLQRSAFMAPSLLNMFLFATYLYKIFPRSKFFGREFMTWCDFDEVMEVETVRGCFEMVRTEVLDRVGVMDDIYFVYGDDIDWCYRFRRAGWKVLYTPEPQIVHYGGGTTGKQLTGKFLFQLSGSKLIFMKKFYGGITFALARLLTSMFFLLRAPYWFLRGLAKSEERAASFETAGLYTKGGVYCLISWTKMLMNRDAVERRLQGRVPGASVSSGFGS